METQSGSREKFPAAVFSAEKSGDGKACKVIRRGGQGLNRMEIFKDRGCGRMGKREANTEQTAPEKAAGGSLAKEPELRDAGCLVLFWEFFKLGIMTIGGGMAMIPQMQAIMVEKNHWVREDDIIDCIAVSQSLPGVIAINMATYIGFEKRKWRGAIAATIGVLLPSLIIIIAVTELLHGIGGNPYVKGALVGIKAAATGLIGWAAYTIARRVVKNWFAAALAIAGFVLITFFNVNAVWVILGSIALGLIYSKVTENRVPPETASGGDQEVASPADTGQPDDGCAGGKEDE